MTTYLVYTPPAAGHVYPLVPGLFALQQRGHRVHVRTSARLVGQLRAAGLDAAPVDERIMASAHPQPTSSGRPVDQLEDLIERGPWEIEDLDRAIAQVRPDVLIVDVNAYGASTAAERSGRPWAMSLPSLLPLPGRGIPPYGLGLPPRSGPLGAVRDRLLWPLVHRAFAKTMLPGVNRLRRDAGLAPLDRPTDYVVRADRLLALTGAPLEYPRTDLPPSVRFVGGQLWDPPEAAPGWLDEDGDPWVLVSCSTHYQADEQLAATAIEALRDEPVRVLVTLADAYDTARLPPAANVRVERFVPHGPVLARATATICPSGMGLVQKSIGAGVPVVAVPFGRDQPEVARRVVQSGAGVALPQRRLTATRLRAALHAARALGPDARAARAHLDPQRNAQRFADAAEELGAADPDRVRAAAQAGISTQRVPL
jgi:UDP:flavonoid glycosyltransferase YjiC (YdhE family)